MEVIIALIDLFHSIIKALEAWYLTSPQAWACGLISRDRGTRTNRNEPIPPEPVSGADGGRRTRTD